MLAIRSTPRVAAIVAAVAGACLMLGGCGGGSAGGTAAAGSTSGAAAPAGGSSSASSAPSVPGFAAPKLTGNFCTDLNKMGSNLPKIPAKDKDNLAALEANGGQLFKEAAAYFTALANEAPAQAGPELKIIAAAYTSIANGGISGGSVSQLEKQMAGITTQGKTGQAFISLITYVSTHCH
jgi:hypothetical protein